jgi:hypothetical protein
MTQERSMFDAMFAGADTALDAVFGATFMYRVGTSLIEITATKHLFEVEADDNKGIVDSWRGWAFDVIASELVLNDDLVTPASGHEIIESMDSYSQVYRVLPLPDSRCFAPADTDGTKLIVYAKEIRKEDL